MTSIGNRWSEPKASSSGQEVLWLAASDPPTAITTFLRSRGLNLVTRDTLSGPATLKLWLIEANGSALVRAPNLTGKRVAVMHPDPGNADALAQSLRAKGAEVVALSLNPDSLQRAETLDPDAVIMEAGDFCSSCWEIVRALWQHPQLRFATIILATPELMGAQQVSALDVQYLSLAVAEVAKEYERIADDARQKERFSFELESLGPTRSLRVLLAAGRPLRVTVGSGNSSIEIDLAEQIIVGAQSPAGAHPTEGLLGVHALNLLLAQRAGHVEVRSVDHPAHTNVMAPLDTALHMAREASSAVRPSGLSRPVEVRPSGVHRPVEARPAAREPNIDARPSTRAPEGASATTASKPKRPGRHDQTLIGVPAVQVDANTLSSKTKPTNSAEAPAPTKASGPSRTLRPSAPETAPAARPSKPAPAPVKRSFPPSAPQRAPNTKAYAEPKPEAAVAAAPTPLVEVVEAKVAPPELTAPRAVPARPPVPSLPPAAKSPPSVPVEVEVAPEPALRAPSIPAHSSEPTPNAPASAALDTVKLDALDAHAVRAFRSGRVPRVPKQALWLAGGLTAALLSASLFAGGAREKPDASPLAPAAAQLVPHARAAEPTPEVREPAQVQAPASVASEEDEVAVGHQNRTNARKASTLSNQANSFRRKKMFPTARVRYLEALRVYPDYPRALAGLVQLSLSEGQEDEALRYARQLVKARPGQAPYQLLLGDAYRATGDDKSARTSYQSAARLGSQTAEQRLKEL